FLSKTKSENIIALTLEQKRIKVIGLIIDCPMGKSLPDCPTKDYRLLSIAEQAKAANAMDEKYIDQIIRHHQQCLEKRVLSIYGKIK
ncbi:MAG: hypothetical protein V3S22_01635, partial [Candidatus Neomarinimicrobiota bacterium]